VPHVPIAEAANNALASIITPTHTFSQWIEKSMCFTEFLKSHLNQPFVNSVCHALHEGFQPFTDTKTGVYPLTWDFSDHPPKSDEHLAFIKNQVQTEVNLGCYSEACG